MIRYQYMSIPDHAPSKQGSIESLYIDVYVSQSEMHILHRAGNESMKTRSYISNIDSCWKVGKFEIVVQVYQLALQGVSTNPLRRVIRLTTFFGGLTNVLISDPVYPNYIWNVPKRLMYYLAHLSSPTST